MKLAVVIDGRGVPLAVVPAAANMAEVDVAEPALADLPAGVAVPAGAPVVADKGYDSDPLRERLAAAGFTLVSPHRANRAKPPTNDGRQLRRYRRRWLVERTNAWLQNFRRVVVRWERYSYVYHGFVQLACALIALTRF
jgi:transposase